jgi:hypothetical protein
MKNKQVSTHARLGDLENKQSSTHTRPGDYGWGTVTTAGARRGSESAGVGRHVDSR